MAVRNFDKISQIGKQKREEMRVANDIKRESFNRLVERIRSHQQDCVDALDTIGCLYKNCMATKFDEWNKNTPIYIRNGVFCIGYYDNLSDSERKKETIRIGYNPLTNGLYFTWSGYGMGESYKDLSDDYIFNNVWESSHYKGGLEKFAIQLESWLKNFFEWVEQL